MELKRTSFGMQIEGGIKKKYEDAFKNLKETDSYGESLEFITSMFEALEKSRPNSGWGIDWAQDIIKAYRTTGKLFIEVYNHYKLEPLEKKIESFENIFS